MILVYESSTEPLHKACCSGSAALNQRSPVWRDEWSTLKRTENKKQKHRTQRRIRHTRRKNCFRTAKQNLMVSTQANPSDETMRMIEDKLPVADLDEDTWPDVVRECEAFRKEAHWVRKLE